ncbi:MAG: alkaline phosphatase family protein [Myxococcota bacterium]|nr:alkaline phosphatase family protein [Myxococcota bacterium]
MNRITHNPPLICLALLSLFSACGPQENPKVQNDGVTETKTALKAETPPLPERVERRLLLLGLDGADFTVMDPLLDSGKLPNFTRLIQAGVRAPLKTFEPTASPLIWTSIATGVPHERHGIADFVVEGAQGEPALLPTSNMRKVAALWNILSKAERTVGVVGYWASYPAEKVNGFLISDQANTLRNDSYASALSVRSSATVEAMPAAVYPRGLAEFLKPALALSADVAPSELGRFLLLPEKKLAAVAKSPKIDVEDIYSIFKFAWLIDRSFVDATQLAISEKAPEFLLVYLNGLDAAEHHFWKFKDPASVPKAKVSDQQRAILGGVIDEYYIYMDEVLGKLLETYPLETSTIIVISDHGHHANPHYDPKSQDHYNRVCSGGHEDAPSGIFITAGKDISTRPARAPSVYDITPTVLALFGLPVGKDMVGRALSEILDPAFLSAHPLTTIDTHSSGWTHSDAPVASPMSDALRKKLEGLGYIK